MFKILLRDVVESDLETLYEQSKNLKASIIADVCIRNKEDFYTHWKTNILAKNDSYASAIVYGDKVAGHICSWHDQKTNKRYLGYWLGESFWGKKIATRGVKEFLRTFPVRPIYASVNSKNIASIKILEKLNFKHETSEVLNSVVSEKKIELKVYKLEQN